jgi:hypothetical protein
LNSTSRFNLSKFYKYAVSVVFGVVIAETYPVAASVFVPDDEVDLLVKLKNAFILILAYFFIISGWINYFKSISTNPHTPNWIGTTRFAVDLFIIYLYYYLISIIPKPKYHESIFVFVFPVIYGAFFLWDILRFVEYKRQGRADEKKGRRTRLYTTGLTLGAILIQAIVYQYLARIGFLMYQGVLVWDIVFIITSFGIIIFYRWITSERRKRRKGKRVKSKNR